MAQFWVKILIFELAFVWQLELPSCYLVTREGWGVCVVCVLHSSVCSRGLKTSSLFSWSSRLSCHGSRRRLTRRCWKPRGCSVCSPAEIQNSPSFGRPDSSWNKSWSNYSNRRRRETRILTWVTQTHAETSFIHYKKMVGNIQKKIIAVSPSSINIAKFDTCLITVSKHCNKQQYLTKDFLQYKEELHG